jgi:hypothetical protein
MLSLLFEDFIFLKYVAILSLSEVFIKLRSKLTPNFAHYSRTLGINYALLLLYPSQKEVYLKLLCLHLVYNSATFITTNCMKMYQISKGLYFKKRNSQPYFILKYSFHILQGRKHITHYR